jgi:hypothetical protein
VTRLWALALLAVALLVAPAAQAADERWPGQIGYDVQLRFDAARGALVGTETIAFVNTGPAPVDHVWLRTWGNGLGSCEQPAVVVTVQAPALSGPSRARCTALQVLLPAPLASGAPGTVQLALEITVPVANDRFGRSGGAFLVGNALPVLAVEDAKGPRLVPYTPLGESFYSMAAAWRLTLDVPAGLEVAATGTETVPRQQLPDGTIRIVSETPAARDLALAIGEYVPTVRQVGNVRIRLLRLQDSPEAAGERLMRDAARAVRRYTAAYGRLGATRGAAVELDVVEARFADFGGMEYPELVMAVGDDSSVYHEVAHQWFYGLVGSDQYREPWLDESLATFANRRLDGSLAECDVKRPLRPFGVVRLSATMHFWDRNPAEYGAVYDGGACALEGLRRGMGATRFGTLLRLYVTTYRMRIATGKDFVALVRKLAPRGFDVDGWLRRSRIDA